ncbi:phage tail protein [Microvirga sp. M2]|uniref:phage tail protein n=1 Tax=Microvirga sp. M2 TaxID=3073270 RepID=UPI0039C2CBC0
MTAVPAPISGLPRFKHGQVQYGAKAYVFEAGTTTPKLTYKDPTFSQEHTHPVAVDGEGNFPAIYIGEGNYDIRIVDGAGAVIGALNQLQGAVTEETEPPPDPEDVDATKLHQTGDMKIRYDSGVLQGWVRANGRSIGSSSSGASERANADSQALFLHLWAKDPNLTVLPSRGVSAAADWAANKTIALPDFRGRALVGLDDMGNTAAGLLTGVTFTSGSATTLGAKAGASTVTLTTAQIPGHTHTATSASAGGHNHTVTGTTNTTGNHSHTYTRPPGELDHPAGTNAGFETRGHNTTANTGTDGAHAHSVSGSTNTTGAHTHSINVEPAGGGEAHNNLQPSFLVSVYIKL